jgi:hypothetical protein
MVTRKREREIIAVTAERLDGGKKDCLSGGKTYQMQAKKDCTPLQ